MEIPKDPMKTNRTRAETTIRKSNKIWRNHLIYNESTPGDEKRSESNIWNSEKNQKGKSDGFASSDAILIFHEKTGTANKWGIRKSPSSSREYWLTYKTRLFESD